MLASVPGFTSADSPGLPNRPPAFFSTITALGSEAFVVNMSSSSSSERLPNNALLSAGTAAAVEADGLDSGLIEVALEPEKRSSSELGYPAE